MMPETVIGVDLGGTKALFVSGPHSSRVATGSLFSPAEFMSMLATFVSREGLQPSRIGIAVPGLIDEAGRVVSCDVLPALAGWSPAEALGGFGCRVTVVNDVKAALLEEMHDAAPDLTGAVVMAGTAIGAAFIAHGRPVLGASGWAGELGYLPYPIGQEVKRLDEIAGGAAMAAKRGVGPVELAELAEAGDAAALAVIDAGGSALGVGLAAVVNLLNPGRLAVGGGALELPGYWQAAVRMARRCSIPELWSDCSLTRVRAGERVVVAGAIRAASD